MRVLLHTGKGGVGKTTLSLATAIGAARHGHRVFVLSTDSAHSLGDALGRKVGSRPTEVAPGVVAQEVDVLVELDRAWQAIQHWLRELLRDDADAMVSEELLVFPGLEELIALRAVRDVEASGDFDVCVVDCAPTGSTLRMLRFPDALRVFMDHFFDLERRGVRLLRPLMRGLGSERFLPGEDFFEAFERLYRDIEDVRQILLDGDRTTARLVVNPARVVVAETRRSFAYLSLYGVATDAVLVNRLLPDRRGGLFQSLARARARGAGGDRRELPGADPAGLAASEGGDRRGRARVARDRSLRRRGSRRALCRGASDPAAPRRRPDADRDPASGDREGRDRRARLKGADLHLRVRDGRRSISLPDSVGRAIERVRLRAPRARDPVLRGLRATSRLPGARIGGGGSTGRLGPWRPGAGRRSWRRLLAHPRVHGSGGDLGELQPRRIVSLVPSLSEALVALGLGDRLVGVTEYCVEPPGAFAGLARARRNQGRRRRRRSSALRPDLVIANQEENTARVVDRLSDRGIDVWVTYPAQRSRGRRAPPRARRARGERRASKGGRRSRLRRPRAGRDRSSGGRPRGSAPGPRVFCAIWRDPWMTVGEDTYIHDLIALCGGENAFAKSSGGGSGRSGGSAGADADERQSATGTRSGGDPGRSGAERRYPIVGLAEIERAAPDVILLPSEPYAFGAADRAELRGLDCPAAGAGSHPFDRRHPGLVVRSAHR